MIRADVFYSERAAEPGVPFRLLYAELGRAKLGIKHFPHEGRYAVVEEKDYESLKEKIRKLLGGNLEVDAKVVAPVFLAAKNHDDLTEQVELLFEKLNRIWVDRK